MNASWAMRHSPETARAKGQAIYDMAERNQPTAKHHIDEYQMFEYWSGLNIHCVVKNA